MPEKEVRKRFKEKYRVSNLTLDDNSAFFLTGKGLGEFRKNIRDLRGFSMFLSKNTFYNGMSFISLAEEFGVSTEAMAIRLEELELFEY